MIYMLDTNVCAYIINKHPESYYKNLELLEINNTIAISAVVLAELQYGVSKSRRKEENQAKLNVFLTRLEVIDYTEECAFYYGELRAALEQKGNNTSEFKRVEGLEILDFSDK